MRNFISIVRSIAHPEDPRRVTAFRTATAQLKWDEQNFAASMSGLFEEVDKLAEAEIHYYFRRRGTRSLVSGITRFLGWVCGTTGLILPLLDNNSNLGKLGYAFLAGAASMFAANSLFGGTEGHVRYVSAQLALERLVTESRIGWAAWLASQQNGQPDRQTGFDLIHAYATHLYTISISETDRWGEAILADVAKYQNSIDARNQANSNAKPKNGGKKVLSLARKPGNKTAGQTAGDNAPSNG